MPDAEEREARREIGLRPTIEEWVEKIQSLLPDLLNEHERLKARIRAAEGDRTTLARELETLRTDNQFLRAEWDDIELHFDKLMREMAGRMEQLLAAVTEHRGHPKTHQLSR